MTHLSHFTQGAWALSLAVLCGTAVAQSTLEERIKKAEQAQVQKEAETRAKELEAKAKDDAAKALAATAASAPRVIINGHPAHVGALMSVQPHQASKAPLAPPAPPPRVDLVEIKGFTDIPGALSAIVHVNGQRYSITMDQSRFGDGWELLRITPDAVEVTHAGERQQIRFVSRMQAPLGGPPAR
jgi:hypothetical protein